MTDFAQVMAHVILVERGGTNGKVDDPHDRGGRTNTGVTQATYDAYRVDHGLPKADVFDMADAERDDIYFHRFWLLGRCDLIDELSPRLALCHMDACVHHGPRAVKKDGRIVGANVMLQGMLGVTRDGWIGTKTLTVLRAMLDQRGEALLVNTYLGLRLQRFEAIVAADPTQAKWLGTPSKPGGWRNRLTLLRRSVESLTPAVAA